MLISILWTMLAAVLFVGMALASKATEVFNRIADLTVAVFGIAVPPSSTALCALSIIQKAQQDEHRIGKVPAQSTDLSLGSAGIDPKGGFLFRYVNSSGVVLGCLRSPSRLALEIDA